MREWIWQIFLKVMQTPLWQHGMIQNQKVLIKNQVSFIYSPIHFTYDLFWFSINYIDQIGKIRWGQIWGQIQWFRDMVKVVKKWNILCQRFLVSIFNHFKSRSWINNPAFYHSRQRICSDGTKIELLPPIKFLKI